MAILNVTPDSFSDGGRHVPSDRAALAATVRAFVAAGATMIDVGGQSTSPGTPEIPLAEELGRVVPAIELIRSLPECARTAVSVDTYRAAVAEAAVAAGADMINDVSAGNMDGDMLATMARLGPHRVPDAHPRHARHHEPAQQLRRAERRPRAGRRVRAARARRRRRGRRRAALAHRTRPRAWASPRPASRTSACSATLDELRTWPGLAGLPWLVGLEPQGLHRPRHRRVRAGRPRLGHRPPPLPPPSTPAPTS